MNTYVIETLKHGRWVYYTQIRARDDQQAFVLTFGNGLIRPDGIRVRLVHVGV